MSELTLLCYGGNNEQDEQFRLSLFIESILKQENGGELKLIFADCTPHNNKFILPTDSRITVLSMPTEDEDIHPAFIRNSLALLADTEFIVHLNPDNYYSPNFFALLMQSLQDNPRRLVMCRKYKLSQTQFNQAQTAANIEQFINQIIQTGKVVFGGRSGCGDCQGVMRELFISMGGYYNGINNGQAHKGDRKYHSIGEDLYLQRYALATNWHFSLAGKHYSVKRGAELTLHWIHKKGCWMCHFWHPLRQCKNQHMQKYKDVH